MENNVYMENSNVGVVNPTPTTENTINDGYMNLQPHSEGVEERIKPYTFRKLNSTDLFPMITIISKIGLDELTSVFEGDALKEVIKKFMPNKDENTDEEGKKGNQVLVGINVTLKIVNKILEHIPTCETEIYTLLANVSGMNIQAVKALDLDVFMEMLIDFVTKEEFKSFFKVASKYIRQ